jgi:hypothetical protein
MSWDGFATVSYPGSGNYLGNLSIGADYGGPDDDPTPLVSIRQKVGTLLDCVEMTEEQLRWFVDEVAPKVLKRMGERP